jgi:hypothetical protein
MKQSTRAWSGWPPHGRPLRARAALAAIALGSAALAGAGLAGCGTGHGASRGTTAAAESSSSPDTAITAIVACYRAHGDPSFPDPVYDPGDGRWHFGTSPGSAPLATQHACQHLFPAASASPPVPQAEFQKLVKLAECLRAHGVPAWPDPDPDGSFPLPPSLQAKSPSWASAATACQQYFPSGGLNVHAAG